MATISALSNKINFAYGESMEILKDHLSKTTFTVTTTLQELQKQGATTSFDDSSERHLIVKWGGQQVTSTEKLSFTADVESCIAVGTRAFNKENVVQNLGLAHVRHEREADSLVSKCLKETLQSKAEIKKIDIFLTGGNASSEMSKKNYETIIKTINTFKEQNSTLSINICDDKALLHKDSLIVVGHMGYRGETGISFTGFDKNFNFYATLNHAAAGIDLKERADEIDQVHFY